MMITIHGLPPTAKYRDLKILIKQQCNISDFILDSLVSDVDGRNKVRVGLADDTEGSHVMKCLNGFRFRGNNLRLVPVGKTSSITQQPSSLDVRGSYQQSDYSNQDLQDRNRTIDATRQTNWANNQWASNQPQLAVQNSYDHQQPAVMPYGQPTNTVVKPHFEQRDAIQSSRSQSQNYNYSAKSNLISLGPQNNILSTLHEIPQVPSQARQPLGRYTNQSYDMPSEKPITIMKDNFQGPNQYNITSSHNQSSYQSQGQISPWATQQPQQKPFEKPLPTFDKKPYDDRKYPFQAKHIQEPSKLDDSYKYERSGRGRSPQRKDFREMEERARAFKGAQYSDRKTPERRMSPSRNITSTGRHFSSGRETSPSGRHVLSTGRHASPTGRHLISTGGHDTPPSRHVQHTSRHPSPGRRGLQSSRDFSPGGHGSQTSRLVSPGRRGLPAGRISPQPGRHFPSGGRYGSPSDRHVAQSGRHISPPGRHVPPGGRHASPPRPMPTERKMSPSRNLSPSRRDSPHLRKDEYIRGSRLSPPPHSQMDRRSIRQSSDRDSGRGMARYPSPHSMDQKQMPYQDGHRNAGIKDVRPAYEPQVQMSLTLVHLQRVLGALQSQALIKILTWKLRQNKRPTDSREAVKKNAISEVQKNLGTETTKSTKNKVQKSAEDKDSEKTQENNPPAEEHDEQFQLNDQMSRILEEELNTIMIEVWQALPDDPPNEAEKFVVEKLRYEASDDLRNVLGLNVTKRLLDVYNPLIVKLHFSCRPEKGSLGKFLNAYNVKTVRHIGTDTNIVAARLTSISDFDKLCTNKDLRCGNAKVTVTPVYKFSKCPAKLNTIFDNNEEEENNVAYKEYNDGKAKDDTSEVGGTKNEATKANKQEINEKVINTKIDNKGNPKQEPKSSNDEIKTSNQKIASDVEQLDNKKPKTTQKEKFTDNKEIKKSEPDNKPKNENVKKITPQNKNIATNPKTAVSDKNETEKINKIISKIEKNIPTKKVAVEKEREFLDEEVMEDEIQEFDDGDEMNDDEILALISEGVVVDECIGSDRE